MLRTRRFKYMAYSRGANPEQLFDLENDPGETRNLARNAAWRAELERHRALLGDWVTQTEDWFAVPD